MSTGSAGGSQLFWAAAALSPSVSLLLFLHIGCIWNPCPSSSQPEMAHGFFFQPVTIDKMFSPHRPGQATVFRGQKASVPRKCNVMLSLWFIFLSACHVFQQEFPEGRGCPPSLIQSTNIYLMATVGKEVNNKFPYFYNPSLEGSYGC